MPSSSSSTRVSRADLLQRIAVRQELDRRACRASAATFIEHHCTIEEPDGTVLPFKLWPFQRTVLRDLQDGNPVIVLKARRLGLSWVVLAFALWLAIHQQGVRVLILCKTGDDASELLDRIRRMLERIQADPGSSHILEGLARPKKERDAVTKLDVGGSTISALVGTPAAARSETAGFVILDEFAFQRGAPEIWRSILPTIEGGGRLACVSTGNGPAESSGLGAEFARQWANAIAGTSGLRSFFFPWMARPDRDEAWKARTIATLGDEERFRVEYPEEPGDAFLSPDADLIYDATHLAACKKLGAELDALPPAQRVGGPLYLGIDWGVHTHMLLARRMAGGGLYVFAEVVDDTGDLDASLEGLLSAIPAGERIELESFDAAEPIVHTQFRKAFHERTGYNPRWQKIAFSKFKRAAIKYARHITKRTYDGEAMRRCAISPDCPVLLSQMVAQEWKDADRGVTEKGNDHGGDALLTLTAELGLAMYGATPNTDETTPPRG